MTKTKENSAKFSKNDVVISKVYREHRDVLKATLEDDKTYSLEEVDIILSDFMKGAYR